MSGDFWKNMSDPWRSPPAHFVVDDESEAVLEEAIHSLTMLRSPTSEGDGLARLHALASLRAQAETLVGDAIGQARDQDYSWKEIAAQLGVCLATPRGTYRTHPRRRLPLGLD